MNRFRFLYVYAPSLAAQTAALCVWHQTLEQIAVVMLVGHAGTLVLMAWGVLFGVRRKQWNPAS